MHVIFIGYYKHWNIVCLWQASLSFKTKIVFLISNIPLFRSLSRFRLVCLDHFVFKSLGHSAISLCATILHIAGRTVRLGEDLSVTQVFNAAESFRMQQAVTYELLKPPETGNKARKTGESANKNHCQRVSPRRKQKYEKVGNAYEISLSINTILCNYKTPMIQL